MGSLREEDQEQDQQPRSRSRAGSLQKTSFFSVAVCFKSSALPLLYSPEQHEVQLLRLSRVVYHPVNLHCYHYRQKRVISVVGALTITYTLIDLQGMEICRSRSSGVLVTCFTVTSAADDPTTSVARR